jgi:quercetin dioxygenase-like cupin family protein
MNRYCAALLAVGLVCAVPMVRAEEMAMAEPVMATVGALVWGDAPPVLPAGAKMAVLTGDPGVAGANYTIRFSVPAGYVVAPHWHPVTENLTVLSGSILVGMGEEVDEAAAQRLSVGEFMSMPAEMRHYALFDEETVIQLHGVGPFGIVYVDPADDPSTAMMEE